MRIVSPPHIVLGLGMMGIVLGALLRTLALQNASEGRTRERAAMLFAASSGFSSDARMKRAFARELGIHPRAYRLLHASASRPMKAPVAATLR